ncbi:hypothetical protein [Cryobacterium mannosilyticum]|uniref:Uncharacterized protein n=1 Tax=Cryobacterium mannosilyticum TaxID=1259190 RepID=A0A4R8W6K0_9MICO|nr:hypothetical protein [Cryobacterium mannosilyticum]TFC03635.1 hypothetical protein E3O32_10060 [Cryobacterium mannosilyticum]
MAEVARMNRKGLPDSLSTIGNSGAHHRQFGYNEPEMLAHRTGKNCALSVRDQLLDQLSVIRVNFSEIDRAHSCIRFFDLEEAA